ncbi:hypothetical protein GCM10009657_28740 [Oryzihumus leptocrescens]
MDSSGLLLAAVATGSVAMPLKLPLPSFGTAEQLAPKTMAEASLDDDIVSEGLEVIESEDVEDEELLAASVPLLPQAARPSGRARARPAMAPA